MLPITVDQVESVFATAKNPNAALKNFIKKEASANAGLGRFAKDLRAAVTAGRPEGIRSFIESRLAGNEMAFLLVARYAHPEVIEKTADQIISKHAEQFNETYSKTDKSISIKDSGKFEAIIKDSAQIIDRNLTEAGKPVNDFMRQVVYFTVFDEEVLPEVFKIVGN